MNKHFELYMYNYIFASTRFWPKLKHSLRVYKNYIFFHYLGVYHL